MDKGSAGNAIKIRRGPLGGKMRYVFFIEAYYKKMDKLMVINICHQEWRHKD